MKILRRRPTETEWKELDTHWNYVLTPIEFEALQNGEIVYSTEFIYRAESTPYIVYDKVDTLPADVVFTNNGGQAVNWSEQLNEKEIAVAIGGAYADQWKERLVKGHIITFPLGNLRLADTKECPNCHHGYREGGSISRKDNETEICGNCGILEAFEDMRGSDKVKIKLGTAHFAWVNEALLRKFETVTGIRRKPEWIKQKVLEDFGFTLESEDDIEVLDKHVRAFFYEDKAEWLKEKMRNEIFHAFRNEEQAEALREAKQRLEQHKGLHNPRTVEHNLGKIAELLTQVVEKNN